MPLPVAAVIGAGASLIQTGADIFANTKLNKKTREWNEKMYGIQRQDALADWNRVNQYNSPEATMDRLKAAGLNPNMIYGSGTDAGGSSSPVRASSAGSWQPKPGHVDTSSAIAGIAMQYDLKMKQAQTDLLEEQKKVAQLSQLKIAADTVNTSAMTDKMKMETSAGMFDLGVRQQTSLQMAQSLIDRNIAESQLMLSRNEREAALNTQDVLKAAAEVLKIRAETANTLAERDAIRARIANLDKDSQLKQMDIDLRKTGAMPHDAAWWRLLLKAVGGNPNADYPSESPNASKPALSPENPTGHEPTPFEDF